MIDFQAILAEGWIQSAEWYASIDSTNSLLKRQIAEYALLDDDHARLLLPRLIVAGEQTAGRGRGEHAWWSPVGCLMSSVALGCNPSVRPALPYLVAIAVAKSIEMEIGIPKRCKIKWPNDVFIGDLKIAGALIESINYRSQSLFIVGTGINVDVDFSNAPEDVRRRATSMKEVRHEPFSSVANFSGLMQKTIHRLMKELCHAILLSNNDPLWWYSEWTNRCYLTGRMIEGTVSSWGPADTGEVGKASLEADSDDSAKQKDRSDQQSGQQFQKRSNLACGECLGLDRNGHLRIRHESGKIGHIVSGSVRIL